MKAMHYCSLHASRIYVSDENKIIATLQLEEEEYDALLQGKASEKMSAFLLPHQPLIYENKAIAEIFGGEFQFPNPAGTLARSMGGYEQLYVIATEHTRRAVMHASQKKDKHIIQAINAISEIDETINLLSERLREWFSLHYPELSRETKDNVTYAELIFQYGSRRNFLTPVQSLGAEIDQEDESSMGLLAKTIVELAGRREKLTEYVNSQSEKIAPNLTHLLGGLITAKLLSCSGGLDELARKPSSTVQLLGAEKALFRHLKTGADPPKHGILFQYPPINSAPFWQRGKIARMVASKVSILARVDFFGGTFIADSIEEDVKRKIEEIKRKYPEAHRKERIYEKRKMGRNVRELRRKRK